MDSALYEFFLSPTKKNHHKGMQFEGMEDIQEITMDILKYLQENDFWKHFDSWKQC
jgi:cytochrome c2